MKSPSTIRSPHQPHNYFFLLVDSGRYKCLRARVILALEDKEENPYSSVCSSVPATFLARERCPLWNQASSFSVVRTLQTHLPNFVFTWTVPTTRGCGLCLHLVSASFCPILGLHFSSHILPSTSLLSSISETVFKYFAYVCSLPIYWIFYLIFSF